MEALDMFSFHRRIDFGALVLGGLILFAGGYYFLRNTLGFNLDELDWEPIWPVLVIALGGSILFGALVRSNRDQPKP
jgi:divalent metal cation (Fe/Co/Zn/Cd) transporter